MRVSIQNLGIVKDAVVDVKPLTVFVGPNNEGKTWVAYLTAAMFGSYSFTQCIDTIEQHLGTFPPLDNALRELLETGSAKLDYVQFAEHYLEIYFNHIAAQAPTWLRSYLNGREISFENLKVRVILSEKDKQWAARFLHALPVDQTWPEGRKSTRAPQQASLIRIYKEQDEPTIHFLAQGKVLEDLPPALIKRSIASDVLQWLHHSVYLNSYVFPVERTTYMTVLPPELYADNSQGRPARSRKPAMQSRLLPIAPVVEFMGMIGTAVRTNPEDRRAPQDRPEPHRFVTRYVDLAAILERDILGGSVDATRREEVVPRELRFRPTNGMELSLPLVSSMVKELSPLVLYLRYVAGLGDLIVIDEPEMNLHPEAQARLMEFLSMLVEAGINVLITTHSSYMVDHLVNLMAAAENANPEQLAAEFFLRNQKAFIAPDSVAVYLFDKGTATNILAGDGMINWLTFSRVSERLADIFARVQQG